MTSSNKIAMEQALLLLTHTIRAWSNTLKLAYGYTVPSFNSCTKYADYPTARPINTKFPGHGCMTSQLNVALIHNLLESLICLAYFFDMLFMGVSATRHCQASGRLVQELSVCTVWYFLQ